ncbi:MAG: hypothetical protein JST86_03295 [Bacteroidetes bacterium]|nr:hypothetical protein [Bacteroidota bacterium]
MKKRYIVCINNSKKEQEEKFIEFLKDNSLAWWHWLPNTWLLSENTGRLSASFIRDAVKEIFDNEYNIVFEISQTNDTWSGFGPSSENKNMFKWLKNNWKK